MKTIPLSAGLANFSFTTRLNDTQLKFTFRWLTRYGYFTVDIFNSDGSALTLGRALHIGVNLLDGLNTGIGNIMLEGEKATLANLGIDNRLNWYPHD